MDIQIESMGERVAGLLPILLDHDQDFGEVVAAVQALHRELAAATGITGVEDLAAHGAGTVLAAGKAIGPAYAAQCVREIIRTVKFMTGVENALIDLADRVEGPIRVLYAGCGPYGTLLLPLATRWPASRLQITLLDIHAFSLESAGTVARALGVEDRVAAYIQDDATTWLSNRPFHLAVSETMAQGLRNEPQVAIMANLWPQLAPGGVAIPERIDLSLLLVDGARRDAFRQGLPEPAPRDGYPMILDCGTVLEVSAAAARSWQEEAAWEGEGKALRCPTLAWPADAHGGRRAELTARVRVYGDTVLDYGESSITLPWNLRCARDARPGDSFAFQYVLGSCPEPRGRLVQRSAA